jgi:hypothetical protein
LVDSDKSMMIHGLADPKFMKILFNGGLAPVILNGYECISKSSLFYSWFSSSVLILLQYFEMYEISGAH